VKRFFLSTTQCLAIALPLCSTGAEAATLTRYQCTLLDGVARVLDQDIKSRFPSLVIGCRPIEVDAADDAEVELIDESVPSRDRSDGSSMPARFMTARGGATQLALPEGLQAIIKSASNRHGVDARLIQAVIQVESAFNPNARSPKGARGLMQLMPATAARFGAASHTDLFNPAVNVDLGTRYLRALSAQFEDRIDLVLAAYNAGEGAVVRNGYEVPPYRETREYVRRILDLYPAGE